jgi:CubicO group peptidase (beta-lactamase class C family)
MRELMAGQPGQDPEQAGFPPSPYGSGAPREWEEDDGAVASLAINKSPLSLMQTPRTRQMDTSSSSGHASARGMAKIMGMMGNLGELGGVRVLSEEGVMQAVQNPVHALARAPPPHGEDAFMMGPTHFVQGGWDAFCAEARGPRGQAGARKRYGTEAFGWGGLGGSAIWFNPVEKVRKNNLVVHPWSMQKKAFSTRQA